MPNYVVLEQFFPVHSAVTTLSFPTLGTDGIDVSTVFSGSGNRRSERLSIRISAAAPVALTDVRVHNFAGGGWNRVFAAGGGDILFVSLSVSPNDGVLFQLSDPVHERIAFSFTGIAAAAVTFEIAPIQVSS